MSLNKQFLLALLSGIVVGFVTAYVILSPDMLLVALGDPHSSQEMESVSGPVIDPGIHHRDEEFHQMENTTVADLMYKKVRILCWVMTGPKNHEKRARHVKATWGKRCNKLIFMSSEKGTETGNACVELSIFLYLQMSLCLLLRSLLVKAEIISGGKPKRRLSMCIGITCTKLIGFSRLTMTRKLRLKPHLLLIYSFRYVILENLRYMLLPYHAQDSIYFGCKFKPYVKQGYMSGGAGYVLSREAVRRFVEHALTNTSRCKEANSGAEDVEIGKCLEAVQVRAGDSRDSLGRGRFFPFVPEHHLIPGHVNKNFWYWQYIYYEAKEGMDCCSDNAVSFHYVTPNQMYVLEYLIYHLRPYGITYNVDMPPELGEEKLTSV